MALNTADADPVASRRLRPGSAMGCTRCGMTVHPAAVQHDQALLLASCCPRCDGPLVPHSARPVEPTSMSVGLTLVPTTDYLPRINGLD